MKIEIEVPDGYTVVLQKKPQTRWFRALKKRALYGDIVTDSYSGVTENNKVAIDFCVKEAIPGFIEWITPWTEYEI